MNPDKQRIAIAEACGWFLMNGNWYMPNGAKATADGGRNEPPDYLNDLNAMYQAEETIGAGDLGCQFKAHLRAVTQCTLADDWYAIHATAAQRAEAFLRTIGRWEDGR